MRIASQPPKIYFQYSVEDVKYVLKSRVESYVLNNVEDFLAREVISLTNELPFKITPIYQQ